MAAVESQQKLTEVILVPLDLQVMPMPTSMPPVVRFAHPMAFAAFLRELGAPAARHLQRHGLPLLCDDPSSIVPLTRAWSFFETAARREDPMLGWLVGAYLGDRSLNADLRRRLSTAPTLLRALQDLARLVGSEASEIRLGIRERGDDVLFYNHVPSLRQAAGYSVAQDYRLSVFLDLISHFLGPSWVPTEIGVESDGIPSVLQERYPGSHIRARQPTGYIVIPKTILAGPACATDSHEDAGDDGARISASAYSDILGAMLRSYLAEGYPSQRFAAELMGTSLRTLTRRLSAEGLTYGKLVDDLRFRAAKEHLQNSDMRIVDVAHATGFADQGDFTRMFRRVGGLSPGAFRRAEQD